MRFSAVLNWLDFHGMNKNGYFFFARSLFFEILANSTKLLKWITSNEYSRASNSH